MDATYQLGVPWSGYLIFVRLLLAIASHLGRLVIIHRLCAFPVFLRFGHDHLFAGESDILVMAQIIVSEEFADSEANLGLSPLGQLLLSDLLEVGRSMCQHSLDEEFCFLATPVVALLDIEILEIQRSIRKADVVLAQ